MHADELAGWRAGLLDILTSARTAPELFVTITDMANVIGHDNAERLLREMPDLPTLRPSIAAEFHFYIVGQEITEYAAIAAALGLPAGTAAPVKFGSDRERAAFESGCAFARNGLRPLPTIAAAQTYREAIGQRAAGSLDFLDALFAGTDFSEVRRIVMVGCGWRPTTAFHLHERAPHAEVLGLDTVPAAVEAATALAQRFGGRNLRFALSDGLRHDFADADLVYVASMVSPKAAVVSRILDTAPDHVRLVLWEPASFGRLWVESSTDAPDPRLGITGRSEVWRLTRHVFAGKTHAA
jgi:hypothetical protein